MKKLLFLTVFAITCLINANAQTITEETCNPGFNRAGNCGFYRDIELTVPQSQRATNIYIDNFSRYAFKDYSNLSYTKVRFKLGGGSGGHIKFQDVDFLLLDENNESFAIIPALVPPENEFIEQEIALNGAHKLQIHFKGSGPSGEAGIYQITEITEIRESIGSCETIFCYDNKVGIGTAFPDSKLTVKGSIHSEEVIVDLNVPGPDYVFEEDYNLISLEETKAYIKANKHLPEVPSAKEMEANGINLSEMSLLLLKKIEEMTLHQIELMEEVKALKAKVKELEK